MIFGTSPYLDKNVESNANSTASTMVAGVAAAVSAPIAASRAQRCLNVARTKNTGKDSE